MLSERVIHPTIKQHFDSIDNPQHADSLAEKLTQIRDKNGDLYSHDTHVSEHALLPIISRLYSEAYDPELPEQTVWQIAELQCSASIIQATIDLPKMEGPAYKEKRDEAINAMLAQFAMFELGRKYRKTDRDTVFVFNRSFYISDPSRSQIEDIYDAAKQSARESGLIVAPEQFDAAESITSLADCIEENEVLVEEQNYTELLLILEEVKESSKDENKKSLDMFTLAKKLFQLKISHNITDDQLDTFAEALIRSAASSPSISAYGVSGLPSRYLRDSFEKEGQAKTCVESVLDAVSKDIDDKEVHRLPQGFLAALRDYFPGGLSSDAAKNHPVVNKIRGLYEDIEFFTDTIPVFHDNYSYWGVQEYNRQIRAHLEDFFQDSLPGDKKFATHFSERMLRSITPRAYKAKGGVYESETVYRYIVQDFTHITNRSPETIRTLHEQYDLGGMDMMTERQMQMLVNIHNKNPETIESLQARDVSLVFFDSYRDHNGFVEIALKQSETNNELLGQVVFPLKEPEDIYKAAVKLRHLGIGFSTLALVSHGGPGRIIINKGPEEFSIKSPMLDPSAEDLPSNKTDFQITDTQIRRLARDYMIAPKHADALGIHNKKRLLYVSCHGANSGQLRGALANNTLKALGEDVAVIGATNTTAVRYDDVNGTGLNLQIPTEQRNNMVLLEKTTPWIEGSEQIISQTLLQGRIIL